MRAYIKFLIQLSLVCVFLLPSLAATGEEAQSSGPFQIEEIASGLDYPWGLAFLPDGSILVTERSGALRVIRNKTLIDEPVADTPQAYVAGQGGYFDVLAHPDFTNNKLIYLSFAHGNTKSNQTRVIRARFDGKSLQNHQVIFDSTTRATPVHYGGRMVFLPDDSLLITTGDGFDYREAAQRTNNSLGKIVRIHSDGSLPDDNPFANQQGGEALWTYGHRSPQGLAYDSEIDRVYMHEHGPRGGDEVNIVKRASNYGWPIATHGIDYSGARISPFEEYEGTVQPIKYWTPSIAPSGLAVYRGDLFPDWQGDLFVGALAGRALHRLDIEDDVVVGEEVLLADLGKRIRDVRVGPDGALYVTTDDPNGRVLRLTPCPR